MKLRRRTEGVQYAVGLLSGWSTGGKEPRVLVEMARGSKWCLELVLKPNKELSHGTCRRGLHDAEARNRRHGSRRYTAEVPQIKRLNV